MPSGSHSGGGGSHFGGGSSSGSHFGGTYSSSGGRSISRPMIFVFHGRRYSVSGGAQSSIMVMLFICAFALMWIFGMSVGLSDCKSDLKKIENDYVYYQSMISYAEEHSAYCVNGKVTGKFYNQDCDKWYLTYSIRIDISNNLDGYTFSVYTFDEISNFMIGQYIAIAVDSIPITNDTDSIPMDYKDMPLSRDGEYKMIKDSMSFYIIGLVISSVILLGLVAGIIVIISKKKQIVDINEQANNEVKSVGKEPARCAYCGASLGENDKSCPSCGAKKINYRN